MPRPILQEYRLNHPPSKKPKHLVNHNPRATYQGRTNRNQKELLPQHVPSILYMHIHHQDCYTQSFTKALKVSMLTYSNWTLFLQQKGGCGNRIGIDALQPKQDYLLLLIYSSGLELIIPISVLQKGLVVRPI